MSIARNLEQIKSRIGDSTEIVGVTKFQPIERIREAVEAGLTHLGVNRVQAGEEIRELLKTEFLTWNFIGSIQSRKAKLLTDYDWVESIDRIEVAEKLNAALLAKEKKLAILVEVNIGEEETKSGVLPLDLQGFLKGLGEFKQLKLRGFMGMPPPLEKIEERRPFFKKMAQIYLHYQEMLGLDTLSMGTSDDYPVAVEEGATRVRLGTSLFGPRDR